MKRRHQLLLTSLLLISSTAGATGFDPGSPDQAIAAGHAAIRQESFLQAANILEQALLANPGNAAVQHHLGIAYYKSGQHESAIERLNKALELAPDHAESHYALGVVYLARAGEASALKVRGAMKNAIQHFEQTIEQLPEHAAAHYYLIQILLNAPAIVGGDKARAAELNDRLESLSPLYHQAVNSTLAAMAEDYAHAEQLLLESHRSAPTNTLINFRLLDYYHGQAQCANAIDFGRRFLAQPKEWDDSNPAQAHLLLAECQQRLGNRQQSLQHYAQALTYNKSDKVVRRVQAAVQKMETTSE